MDGNERRKYAMYMFLSGKLVENAKNCTFYEPKDDDVIIVGPPKSGTTWLQQILHQIRTKGDESFRDIYDVTWYIPSTGASGGDFDLNADQVCKPRIYKHHEAFGVIKMTNRQKHIVIVRDPYDSAFSYLKWINRWFGGNDDISDQELAHMINKTHKIQKFSNYTCVETWFQHRNDSNVLFVFYEDFVKNLKFMLAKVSEFVGVKLTADEMDKVYRLSTFQYMVEHKEKFQAEPNIEMWAKSMGIEKWSSNMGMVREDGGKIGQGEKNIGPKLRATVDRLWQEAIGIPLGFKDYRDMYMKCSALRPASSKL